MALCKHTLFAHCQNQPALRNNLHLHQASSKPTAKPCAKRRLAILLPLEASSMLLLFYSAVATEERDARVLVVGLSNNSNPAPNDFLGGRYLMGPSSTRKHAPAFIVY